MNLLYIATRIAENIDMNEQEIVREIKKLIALGPSKYQFGKREGGDYNGYKTIIITFEPDPVVMLKGMTVAQYKAIKREAMKVGLPKLTYLGFMDCHSVNPIRF